MNYSNQTYSKLKYIAKNYHEGYMLIFNCYRIVFRYRTSTATCRNYNFELDSRFQ